MEYYLDLKMKATLKFTVMWVDLEDIVLSEISQS